MIDYRCNVVCMLCVAEVRAWEEKKAVLEAQKMKM